MSEDPRFPFGFGLSYTTFTLANLVLSAPHVAATGSLTVSVDVTNAGARAGYDVVQMYVSYPGSTVMRAPLDLKGFARVHLEAGESKTVTVPLAAQALAYYDVGASAFAVEPLTYAVHVGSSSRDLPLQASFAVP